MAGLIRMLDKAFHAPCRYRPSGQQMKLRKRSVAAVRDRKLK